MPIPKTYCHSLSVKPEDLDELNHVNNVVYLSYLQEAAIAHWYSTAPKEIVEAIRWVVRKHEIEYFKPAHNADELTVTTWVSNFTQVTSERHYEIKRGDEILVKASTLWIALDAKKMKPTRIPAYAAESFFQS
ncbi:acyl-CoA thioesterase [Arcticibacterium luteifluviistationis]|uniref:Thioesterase n=1 Tax=Arcticibacterium luteifluviistationis TaxID=1784714 RepID=A0A2Z4GFU9_9BACT|nr:thioesterase family protein [Arcticibacterium luteifluviistationis]AWW00187.1 thioesterase [Arcticibacterium luteifluviistationis]